MLEAARPGDTIVVWRLDRLGRNLKDLIATVGELKVRGVALRSLKEHIDTATPTGKLMFHLERTQAGLEAARARGKKGGRRPAVEKLRPGQLERAKALYATRENTVGEIMALTSFKSRASFYTYVVDRDAGTGTSTR